MPCLCETGIAVRSILGKDLSESAGPVCRTLWRPADMADEPACQRLLYSRLENGCVTASIPSSCSTSGENSEAFRFGAPLAFIWLTDGGRPSLKQRSSPVNPKSGSATLSGTTKQ